jgi:hypothetical protein
MFNLEEFERDQVIYPLVEKLSKFLDKNKTARAHSSNNLYIKYLSRTRFQTDI